MLLSSPGLLGSLTTTPGSGIWEQKEIDQEFSKGYLEEFQAFDMLRYIFIRDSKKADAG